MALGVPWDLNVVDLFSNMYADCILCMHGQFRRPRSTSGGRRDVTATTSARAGKTCRPDILRSGAIFSTALTRVAGSSRTSSVDACSSVRADTDSYVVYFYFYFLFVFLFLLEHCS